MTAASDIYPGFISLDEAFSLTEDKVKEMQLAHMNEYRTKMGLEGGHIGQNVLIMLLVCRCGSRRVGVSFSVSRK